MTLITFFLLFLLQFVLSLQSRCRGYCARQEAGRRLGVALVRDRAACCIQSNWRAYKTRCEFVQILTAVVKIQSWWRGVQQRCRYLALIKVGSVWESRAISSGSDPDLVQFFRLIDKVALNFLVYVVMTVLSVPEFVSGSVDGFCFTRMGLWCRVPRGSCLVSIDSFFLLRIFFPFTCVVFFLSLSLSLPFSHFFVYPFCLGVFSCVKEKWRIVGFSCQIVVVGIWFV